MALVSPIAELFCHQYYERTQLESTLLSNYKRCRERTRTPPKQGFSGNTTKREATMRRRSRRIRDSRKTSRELSKATAKRAFQQTLKNRLSISATAWSPSI